MYTIIGTHGCPRCDMIKGILEGKNISFEYKLITDLLVEEQNKYFALAAENKVKNFPLIVKDNKLYELQEVV